MKNLLFTTLSATILLVACNSAKKDNMNTEKQIVFTDTSLLKQSNMSTDKGMEAQNEAVVAQEQNNAPKTQVRTVTKYIRVKEKQPAPAPVNTAAPVNTPAPVAQAPAPAPATETGSGTNNTDAPVVNSEPVPQKKKGWSDAAKGATMGGVGGAVAGAIISKNKGKGAIIGGVIGAAGGYILGRKADKKSGRAEVTTTTAP